MPRSQPHIQLRWNHHNSYKNRGKWKGDCKGILCCPEMIRVPEPVLCATLPLGLLLSSKMDITCWWTYLDFNYSGANSTFLAAKTMTLSLLSLGCEWAPTCDREKEKCHPKALQFFRIILQLTCLVDSWEKFVTFFKHKTWPFFRICAI